MIFLINLLLSIASSKEGWWPFCYNLPSFNAIYIPKMSLVIDMIWGESIVSSGSNFRWCWGDQWCPTQRVSCTQMIGFAWTQRFFFFFFKYNASFFRWEHRTLLVAKITRCSSQGFLRVQGRACLPPETRRHIFPPLLSHSAATRTRPVVLAIVPCVVFTMITGVQDVRVLCQDTPHILLRKLKRFLKKIIHF